MKLLMRSYPQAMMILNLKGRVLKIINDWRYNISFSHDFFVSFEGLLLYYFFFFLVYYLSPNQKKVKKNIRTENHFKYQISELNPEIIPLDEKISFSIRFWDFTS